MSNKVAAWLEWFDDIATAMQKHVTHIDQIWLYKQMTYEQNAKYTL